ncbi:MAG: glycosyltransferase family 2 protein [Proteobacteria bacterium]|nr:glycosyltransferase family 2 protein [Pseudomonadota bacterium]
MSFSLVLAAIAFILVLCCSLILAGGVKKLRRLDDTGGQRLCREPRVSVIVPACNEEKKIEQSVLSLLTQNYGNLEILVVNDRSVDGTAQVLNRLKALHPRLISHDITELPAGWMGKSHAMTQGVTLASGEYLLFTDADVVMEPTTISRAMRHMLDDRLDHLSLIFKNLGGGWLLNCLILEMALGLLLFFRPWSVRQRGGRNFIGIGAFNLVKKTAYVRVGGHDSIRMHPIDDLMLGKILKEQGFRQDCLLAHGFVAVPWYDTVRAMIKGLQKNTFAFIHYRLYFLLPIVGFLIIANILPLWGTIFCEGAVRLLWLLTLGMKLMGFFFGLRRQGMPTWYLFGALLAPYLSLYIICNSAIVVLKNNGITWRGRFYALAELKKSRKLFL